MKEVEEEGGDGVGERKDRGGTMGKEERRS